MEKNINPNEALKTYAKAEFDKLKHMPKLNLIS